MTLALVALLLTVISLVHGLPSGRGELTADSGTNGFKFEEFIEFAAKSPVRFDPDTWAPFQFYVNLAGGFPTFQIEIRSKTGQLEVTDLYCQGDAFIVLITSNQGDLWVWSSSAPNSPSCDDVITDPDIAMEKGWSYASLSLPGPAVYDVSIVGTPSPFGGGGGAIRWSNKEKGSTPSARTKA